MDADVTIRLLSADDAALLDSVHADVFDEPVRADRLRAYLDEPGHLLLVAIHDGLVVAQVAAVIHRHPDKVAELYVDEVGVAGPWQRRGLATAMMRRMLAIGRERGCGEAWVGTEPDNLAARRLYEKFGGDPAETFTLYGFSLSSNH